MYVYVEIDKSQTKLPNTKSDRGDKQNKTKERPLNIGHNTETIAIQKYDFNESLEIVIYQFESYIVAYKLVSYDSYCDINDETLDIDTRNTTIVIVQRHLKLRQTYIKYMLIK